MNAGGSSTMTMPAEKAKEIAALIETLRKADERLDELTSGEVDTVADRDGQIFLLQRTQDRLRFKAAEKQGAILDAMPAHVALLDVQGVIVSVNDTWRRFADTNALLIADHGIGTNYLDVCDSAGGKVSVEAAQVVALHVFAPVGKLHALAFERAFVPAAHRALAHVARTHGELLELFHRLGAEVVGDRGHGGENFSVPASLSECHGEKPLRVREQRPAVADENERDIPDFRARLHHAGLAVARADFQRPRPADIARGDFASARGSRRQRLLEPFHLPTNSWGAGS